MQPEILKQPKVFAQPLDRKKKKNISLSFFNESCNRLILPYAREFRNLQDIILSKQRPSAIKQSCTIFVLSQTDRNADCTLPYQMLCYFHC